MADKLTLFLGGRKKGLDTVVETITDSIGINDVPPTTVLGGPAGFESDLADSTGMTDTLSVTLWRDPPNDVRQPTAEQFLGLSAMPTGWAARVQHVIAAGKKIFLTDGIPYSRNRGVMANEETLDMRGVQIDVSPRIANTHSAPMNINHLATINRSSSHADSTCSLRPALVGSIITTPKAQVGRIWGNPTDAVDSSGRTYTHCPHLGTWRQWKGEKRYQGQAIDGVPATASSFPWDTEAVIMDCKLASGSALWTDLKQRSFLEGVWFRDIMDGPCTVGSMAEIRNCLFQWVHDDCHEQDVLYAPLYLYRNLYWNIFAFASFRNMGQPDNSAMTFVVEDCILSLNRSLPYPAVDQFSGDDPNTCWDGFMHGDIVKTGQSGKPPKFEFHNTKILMIGQPGQGGFATSGQTGEGYLPAGSTADSSCEIYYLDLHGDGKKFPTSAPSGKVTFANAGFKIHYLSGLNDPLMVGFWDAVRTWIAQHPQYGFPTTLGNDWNTNNAILSGT